MATRDPERPTFFTGVIAQLSRRRRRVFIVGAVLALVLGIVAISSGTDTDLEGGGVGESGDANELLADRFNTTEGPPTEIVVFDHPTLTVDDPVYKETVEGLMLRLREIRGARSVTRGGTVLYASTRVVANTTTHYDLDASRLDSPFVAQNSTGGDFSLAQLELEEISSVVRGLNVFRHPHPSTTIRRTKEQNPGGVSLSRVVGRKISLPPVAREGFAPSKVCRLVVKPSVARSDLTGRPIARDRQRIVHGKARENCAAFPPPGLRRRSIL